MNNQPTSICTAFNDPHSHKKKIPHTQCSLLQHSKPNKWTAWVLQTVALHMAYVSGLNTLCNTSNRLASSCSGHASLTSFTSHYIKVPCINGLVILIIIWSYNCCKRASCYVQLCMNVSCSPGMLCDNKCPFPLLMMQIYIYNSLLLYLSILLEKLIW